MNQLCLQHSVKRSRLRNLDLRRQVKLYTTNNGLSEGNFRQASWFNILSDHVEHLGYLCKCSSSTLKAMLQTYCKLQILNLKPEAKQRSQSENMLYLCSDGTDPTSKTCCSIGIGPMQHNICTVYSFQKPVHVRFFLWVCLS